MILGGLVHLSGPHKLTWNKGVPKSLSNLKNRTAWHQPFTALLICE